MSWSAKAERDVEIARNAPMRMTGRATLGRPTSTLAAPAQDGRAQVRVHRRHAGGVASRRRAFSVGKPKPAGDERARKELGRAQKQTVMIVDTMKHRHSRGSAANLLRTSGTQWWEPGATISPLSLISRTLVVEFAPPTGPCAIMDRSPLASEGTFSNRGAGGRRYV